MPVDTWKMMANGEGKNSPSSFFTTGETVTMPKGMGTIIISLRVKKSSTDELTR